MAGIGSRVYRRRLKPLKDTELLVPKKERSSGTRRFGYRRLLILPKQECWQVNWKKHYHIYRKEALTIRRRSDRKRAIRTRAPMAIPQEPNQRWSLDFVSDALSDGRRFRVLCVIDDFSSERLAAIIDTSILGIRRDEASPRDASGQTVNAASHNPAASAMMPQGRRCPRISPSGYWP